MYHPIQTARLYEQVVQQIEDRIIECDIEPGDRLPSEIELAAQFGVSRTVIREAIKALRAKGLIEVHLGRGTFVAGGASQILHTSLGQLLKGKNQKCMQDLNELREILEPNLSALAVERADEEDLRSMQSAIDYMEATIDNPESFIQADLNFHLAVARATKNPIADKLISPILDLLRGQLMPSDLDDRQPENKSVRMRRIAQHKRILKSFFDRDPQGAIEAMHEHLDAVRSVRTD